MNIHDLNIFATAARLGSITKAATSLATVQSNVTTRIQLLEEELGAQLFRRNHRGIQLTPKGEEFLPYAQQVLALLQKARESIAGKDSDPQGGLRIGSVQSTAAARLPGLLKAYAAKFSKVDIAIETGMASELIERVLDYRIDGAFVSGLVDRPELKVIPAFLEEVVVVTPTAYRSVKQFLKNGPVPKVLVFRAGCFYRQRLTHYLSAEGFDQLEEMEFGTFDGIVGCVSAGLGITMLPRSVVERCAQRGEVRMHALPSRISAIETSFIIRKGATPTTALERLIDVVVECRRDNGRGGK